MYVLALSDYKHSAAAAGYKPAPQLGRYAPMCYITYALIKQDCVGLRIFAS